MTFQKVEKEFLDKLQNLSKENNYCFDITFLSQTDKLNEVHNSLSYIIVDAHC